MNKVHAIIPAQRGKDAVAASTTGKSKPVTKTRKPTMTASETSRFLQVAIAAGLTIHAVEFDQGVLRLFTKPIQASPAAAKDDAEEWLRRNG